MKQVLIEQWPDPLHTKKDTILETALKAGVPHPHQCRSGECGKCKTRLVSGKVQQFPCLADALSPDERADGMILACRSVPQSDIEISWHERSRSSSLPLRHVAASVHSIEQVSRSVLRLLLRPQGPPFEFIAGQYLQLQVGDLPARSYSMANMSGAELIELHVGRVAGGLMSGFIAEKLRQGDAVRIEGPFGVSCLQDDDAGPIMAVAGATGLASIMSITRTALKMMPERPIHLYYGARDEPDIYAGPELSKLSHIHPQLNVDIALSAASQQTPRRSGYVHQAFDHDFDFLPGACLYTAGPPVMVDAVKAVAIAKGIAPESIYTDAF